MRQEIVCKGADGTAYKAGSPAGGYTVSLSWKGEGQPDALHNYKVALGESKTLTVSKDAAASMTASLETGSPVFGDELAFKVTCGYGKGSAAGEHPVMLSWRGGKAPESFSNYNVELEDGRLTVEQAPGSVDVSTSKDDQETDSFTYGDTITVRATVAPAQKASANALSAAPAPPAPTRSSPQRATRRRSRPPSWGSRALSLRPSASAAGGSREHRHPSLSQVAADMQGGPASIRCRATLSHSALYSRIRRAAPWGRPAQRSTNNRIVVYISIRMLKSSCNRIESTTKETKMVLRESPSVEYKEAVSPSFLKTVSAYANYGTGRIVFGVDDAGAVAGLPDPIASCLCIENMINDSLDPVPRYTLDPDEEAKTVTLTVFEGQDKPYRSKGKAYRRSDSATVEVDRLEYGRLVLEGSNLSFDRLTSARQDLTFDVLERKLVEKLGIAGLSGDIMRTLGLLDKEGYTNAAALLADANGFPGIDMVRFGETEDTILDRASFSGISVLAQTDDALEVFDRYYAYEQVVGARRIRRERVPLKAFREAVANALVHRTWDVAANVQVALHDDRVVVTSPGSLPPDLTTERYLYGQISVLRNPVLAEVFLKLDYIEKFGTGIARIRRAYQDSVSQPLFDVRGDAVTVVLPAVDSFDGSEDERRIMVALSGGCILSRRELEEVTSLSRMRVLAALGSLLEKRAVTKTGAGRATKYARS